MLCNHVLQGGQPRAKQPGARQRQEAAVAARSAGLAVAEEEAIAARTAALAAAHDQVIFAKLEEENAIGMFPINNAVARRS